MTYATLALDLGTHMGWALKWPSGKIESGAISFPCEPHEGEGARYLKFRAWLHSVKFRIERNGTELEEVIFERAAGLQWKNAAAGEVAIGLRATLLAWAEHHGIAYGRGVNPMTLKKATTGRGNAKKPEMIAAMRARGFDPKDDNEADALALLLLREPQAEAA